MGRIRRQDEEERVKVASIFCRMVGPGGTTVNFYATEKGIECVWTNENCPYTQDGGAYPGQRVITADERGAASDGHNVDVIDWGTVREMAALAP